MQNVAWQSVSNYYNTASVPSMDHCQAVMRDQVCNAYANYAGNAAAGSSCVARFREQTQSNPFYYNAATDYGYWFR